MSARRFADKRDTTIVHLVTGPVLFYVFDGAFDILRGGRELIPRRQAVVDAEPCKSSVRKWLEDVCDELPVCPCDPISSMNKNGRRKGTCSVGNVRVQRKGHTSNICAGTFFEIFSVITNQKN